MVPKMSDCRCAVVATAIVCIAALVALAMVAPATSSIGAVAVSLFGQLGTFAWVILTAVVIWMLREPIQREFLPRLRGLKLAGVEIELAERAIERASTTTIARDIVTKTHQKIHIHVTKAEQERAIARASRCIDVLRNKRILWIDDELQNNWNERRMLGAFQIDVEQVTSNTLANTELVKHRYDLVITDIERPLGEPTGLDFVKDYGASGGVLPVIVYITNLKVDLPTPLGAFGITNRPDTLLHLVIDALERTHE